MIMQEIDRRSGLTPETFAQEYLHPLKPVVFTDLMDAWPAKNKWTVEFFKEKYGHLEVPVFSENYSKPGKGYMEPDKIMSFKAFLSALDSGPTDLRMFLFNIFRHAPELCNDFSTHTIMNGFIKQFPFMFFGGEGSHVALHYDIDMAHVFLNQIYGRKRVVLFSQDQSKYLYHHPYTVASYIDVNNPDYEKYPALRKVKGYAVMLQPGETLFMPSGYWHYIEYTDFGYSISLRAMSTLSRRVMGIYNIATHFVVDKGMNKIMGPKWREIKANMAKKRAEDELV
jgi:hypothetical protein